MNWTSTACDPAHSVVVEACAGSGKTWLLTARLFRLLLAGAKPDQILAITFTRKAAQEMQERLFDLLRECALVSDSDLNTLLSERGAKADAHHRQRARSLAGEVLTNSRGVTINTFHGWFTSLCQLAPLSSGFSRQSEPTEQVDFWMDKAIDAYTQRAIQDASVHPEQQHALNTLARILDRQGMRQVLKKALSDRVACALVRSNPHAPTVQAVFGLDDSAHWPFELLAQSDCVQQVHTVARYLGMGSTAQQTKANELLETFELLQQSTVEAQAHWELFRALFLTKTNQPKALAKSTKAQKDNSGFDEQVFQAACEWLQTAVLHAELRAQDQLDMRCTQALFDVMEPLFQTYAHMKAEQGLCDFDDLEATALRMMMDEEQRAYMQQKLDSRVQHLLIDEFQDTNPVQWSILRLWLEDYSTPERPSVFLVGDPKQSIYRFRRAEARLFEQAKHWLQQHFNAQVFNSDSTRRCAQGVVALVNRVFASESKRGNTTFRPHESLTKPKPSSFLKQWPASSVYPLVGKEEPRSQAQRCVDVLQHWLNTQAIEGLHEVMVLVQTHASALPLMDALREANLPYSVKDKGERYLSVVWSDTVALLAFLNDPHDKLALLQLLRSPLLGVSVHDLQHLMYAAHQEHNESVWNTLARCAASAQQPWQALHTQLQTWLDTAQALPLFETINKVVSDTQASVRYLNAALPRERLLFAEHWDWLKAWALNVNKGRFPSLQSALQQARQLQEYVGSDSDGLGASPHVLRIMTVHSAKGLEANHVWLFDANKTMTGSGSKAGLLFEWPLGDTYARSVTVMSNMDHDSPSRQSMVTREKQAHLDEADHLLYVALTRARHSVHISGRQEGRGAKDGWYARLQAHADHTFESWPVQLGQQGMLFEVEQAPPMWVRPQFPVLTALPHAVGRNVPRPNSAELRMGTAWHGVLEHIDKARNEHDFEHWWANRQSDCEALILPLTHDECAQVKQACWAVWNNSTLRPWMQDAPKAFNELEWVVPPGRSLRADRVVELPNGYVVLDYKWSVGPENFQPYREQVLEYVGLVDSTLNADRKKESTQAALIDRQGAIHWLTSV